MTKKVNRLYVLILSIVMLCSVIAFCLCAGRKVYAEDSLTFYKNNDSNFVVTLSDAEQYPITDYDVWNDMVTGCIDWGMDTHNLVSTDGIVLRALNYDNWMSAGVVNLSFNNEIDVSSISKVIIVFTVKSVGDKNFVFKSNANDIYRFYAVSSAGAIIDSSKYADFRNANLISGNQYSLVIEGDSISNIADNGKIKNLQWYSYQADGEITEFCISEIKYVEKVDPVVLARSIASAKTELEEYKQESDYYEEQWTEIQSIILEGETALDGSESLGDVATILQNYKDKLDDVLNKGQVDLLNQGRETAKQTISEYLDMSKYNEEEVVRIKGIIDAESLIIDDILSQEEFDEEVVVAKKILDLVPTKEEKAVYDGVTQHGIPEGATIVKSKSIDIADVNYSWKSEAQGKIISSTDLNSTGAVINGSDYFLYTGNNRQLEFHDSSITLTLKIDFDTIGSAKNDFGEGLDNLDGYHNGFGLLLENRIIFLYKDAIVIYSRSEGSQYTLTAFNKEYSGVHTVSLSIYKVNKDGVLVGVLGEAVIDGLIYDAYLEGNDYVLDWITVLQFRYANTTIYSACENYKRNRLAELFTGIDSTNYYADDWSGVLDILSKAKQSMFIAESNTKVDNAFNIAKTGINSILTRAEIEAFESDKEQALLDLSTYCSSDDYDEIEYNKILSYINAFSDKLDEILNYVQLEEEKESIKAKIDLVATKEEKSVTYDSLESWGFTDFSIASGACLMADGEWGTENKRIYDTPHSAGARTSGSIDLLIDFSTFTSATCLRFNVDVFSVVIYRDRIELDRWLGQRDTIVKTLYFDEELTGVERISIYTRYDDANSPNRSVVIKVDGISYYYYGAFSVYQGFQCGLTAYDGEIKVTTTGYLDYYNSLDLSKYSEEDATELTRLYNEKILTMTMSSLDFDEMKNILTVSQKEEYNRKVKNHEESIKDIESWQAKPSNSNVDYSRWVDLEKDVVYVKNSSGTINSIEFVLDFGTGITGTTQDSGLNIFFDAVQYRIYSDRVEVRHWSDDCYSLGAYQTISFKKSFTGVNYVKFSSIGEDGVYDLYVNINGEIFYISSTYHEGPWGANVPYFVNRGNSSVKIASAKIFKQYFELTKDFDVLEYDLEDREAILNLVDEMKVKAESMTLTQEGFDAYRVSFYGIPTTKDKEEISGKITLGIEEIRGYVSQKGEGNYYNSDWQRVISIKEEYEGKISESKTVIFVDQFVAEAKLKIDLVLTKAERDEISSAIDQAKIDIANSYNEEDYEEIELAKIKEVKDYYIPKIEDLEDVEEISKLLQRALDKIDLVATKEEKAVTYDSLESWGFKGLDFSSGCALLNNGNWTTVNNKIYEITHFAGNRTSGSVEFLLDFSTFGELTCLRFNVDVFSVVIYRDRIELDRWLGQRDTIVKTLYFDEELTGVERVSIYTRYDDANSPNRSVVIKIDGVSYYYYGRFDSYQSFQCGFTAYDGDVHITTTGYLDYYNSLDLSKYSEEDATELTRLYNEKILTMTMSALDFAKMKEIRTEEQQREYETLIKNHEAQIKDITEWQTIKGEESVDLTCWVELEKDVLYIRSTIEKIEGIEFVLDFGSGIYGDTQDSGLNIFFDAVQYRIYSNRIEVRHWSDEYYFLGAYQTINFGKEFNGINYIKFSSIKSNGKYDLYVMVNGELFYLDSTYHEGPWGTSSQYIVNRGYSDIKIASAKMYKQYFALTKGYDIANYDEGDRQEISEIYEELKTKAESMMLTQEEFDVLSVRYTAIFTTSYKAELVQARYDGVEELNNYLDKSNYYEEQQGEIEAIILENSDRINSSVNLTEISEIIINAKVSLDLVKTKVEIDAINVEREEYKDKIDSIVAGLNIADTDKLSRISELVNQAKEDIGELEDVYDMLDVYNIFNLQLSDIVLSEEKGNAKLEIGNYIDKSKLNETKTKEIEELILNYNFYIDNAISSEDISNKVAEYKVKALEIKERKEIKESSYKDETESGLFSSANSGFYILALVAIVAIAVVTVVIVIVVKKRKNKKI